GGAGVKGLLASALADRFHAEFAPLRLLVQRYLDARALARAVAANEVWEVRLSRRVGPDDELDPSTRPWLDGAVGKLELRLTGAPATKGIASAPIRRLLDVGPGALEQIKVFSELRFDSVSVGTRSSDGALRTYDLLRPLTGRGLTVALDLPDIPDV